MGNLSERCWVYSFVCVIVSARASPCKLKYLPSAINSWSCSVLRVAVSLVSAGLIRQTGNGHRLEPTRIPHVLEMEEPPSTRSALRAAGSHRSDSQDEPGQSSVGSATHSRGTVETGIGTIRGLSFAKRPAAFRITKIRRGFVTLSHGEFRSEEQVLEF
jgi:hypothetical protein